MSKYKEVVILIAEDDDGHAELISDGLREAGVNNEFIRFEDGLETWNFLSGEGKGRVIDFNKHYLLLLDINMPRLDGIQVLERIKKNETLKEIPIIILTTTDDPREVEKCYSLGCNFYVTKPVDFAKFASTLNRIGLFFQVVKL